MTNLQDYWNKKHLKYAQQDWIDEPNIFAEQCLQYLPQNGRILDMGAGQGQDARFFAQKGYQIVAIDFSTKALELARQKLPISLKNKVKFKKLDLAEKLPFKDSSFEAVYAHLSIHYFTQQKTRQIFGEIYRVLAPNGILAILVNSTMDPEYGQGEKIEEYLYKFDHGIVKRFFDMKSVADFTSKFKTLLLDNRGMTYKDKKIGTSNLIRFIGQKVW
jgi:ubiquinone/menaquinone biosynthesis C-methylase UbiE